jgi:polysaccharide deacetylase 2 family uncharacterized protein YibQ
VATRDEGEVEFAPRTRVSLGRVAAFLLPVIAAGFFACLYFWLPAERPAAPPLKVAAVIALPAPAVPPPQPARPGAAPTSLPGVPANESAAAPPTPSLRERVGPDALAPAPDPGLVEKGANGPLPIVGGDGRQPWRVYARPFDKGDRRPRVAVIITGLGPTATVTAKATNELPGAVTLAFDPYTRRLGDMIERARNQGHEVLLTLPMEPNEFPRQDPGPYTLLTSLSPRENLDRLDWVLSRVTGYIGLTNMMGSRFTTSQVNLVPVFDELKKRGLLFVDARASEQSVAGALAGSMGVARATADDTLDAEQTREAIDKHLALLEDVAKKNGSALGLGFAYPVTVDRVALWAGTLEAKGIALAPASALAEQRGAK